MLTKRIIPCLDIKDGRTVKGINFENIRDAGDPVELGALYAAEGADDERTFASFVVSSFSSSLMYAPEISLTSSSIFP